MARGHSPPEPIPGVREGCLADQFVLGRELGCGSYAVVREVMDAATGRAFACKIIPKSSVGRRDAHYFRQCLAREVQLGREASARTGAVARLEEAFQDREHLYLVMELCRGGTLTYHVRRRSWERRKQQKSAAQVLQRVLSLGAQRKDQQSALEIEAAWIISEVSDALVACHDAGIIHRDLKPDNVLLTSATGAGRWACGMADASVGGKALKKSKGHPSIATMRSLDSAMGSLRMTSARVWPSADEGSTSSSTSGLSVPSADGTGQVCVKLADFGVAERVTDGHCTSHGLVGSPAFMAPEVANYGRVGTASDIWSLGVVLYFVLSEGHLPFVEASTAQLMERIGSGDFNIDSPHLVGISREAKGALKSLLERDPSKRPSARGIREMPWVQEQLKKRLDLLKQQCCS